MDGTETGWGRPAEPAPRWRALLDRALGSRTGEQPTVGDADSAEQHARADAGYPEPLPGSRAASINPLPTRPVNPLDLRHRDPLDQPRQHPLEPRHPQPDQRENQQREVQQREVQQREFQQPEVPRREPRPANPLQRPVNPLEPRRHSRPGSGYHGRGEAEPPPHSYFNPTTRAVPPPISRVTQDPGYPPVRAAASVGSAAVLPPPHAVPPQVGPPQVGPLHVGEAQVGEAQVAHTVAAPPSVAQPSSRPFSPMAGQMALPAAPHVALPAAAPAVPPQPQRITSTPSSPAPARIEWRQARPEEDVERAVAMLRRAIGRPRVLAFANPKGGVHKTTATVLAAATIGSVRGRGVLAWDDNELRGTLGLRAGSARHARTIRHLVSDLMQIENLHGDDLIHRLDDYLRHASDGSYDVLAGEENPRFAQRLDQHTVGRVMNLLRRTHDVICVDTGNNVESVNWKTVMKVADQLVITTVPREDAAFTADWMLDLLEDNGRQDLVANAVTLISCPSPGRLPLLDDFAKHFATRTRAVAVVPYDPALEVGSSIEYSLLQPDTRQAWLRAASVMIEPFVE